MDEFKTWIIHLSATLLVLTIIVWVNIIIILMVIDYFTT